MLVALNKCRIIGDLFSDDDDFELNYILDRNVQIAYMLADDVHAQLPVLERDVFWGQSNPIIPHTKASMKKPDIAFKSHLSMVKIKNEDMVLVKATDEEYSKPESSRTKFRKVVLSAQKSRLDKNDNKCNEDEIKIDC